MTAPQQAKAWRTPLANQRRPYTSLIDSLSWWVFTIKGYLVAGGLIVDYSCDGVTGPANAADHTDRIASAANFQTRATVDAAAQSWFILKHPSTGVQYLFDYQGATDDIARISYSPGGLFTLAGTTTNRPTASDELVVSAATTIVSGTATLDRVGTIWQSSDAKQWRAVLFRNGSTVSGFGVEEVTRIAPSTTFPIPYVGWNFVGWSRDNNVQSLPACNACTNTVAIGGAGFRGYMGRVFTNAVSRSCRMGGGAIPSVCYQLNANGLGPTTHFLFNQQSPAAQGGLDSPTFPITLWGETAANLDGCWGQLIDWTQMITNSFTVPGNGTFVPGFDVTDVPGVSGGQTGVGDARTNWFVAMGAAAIWPWKNAAVSLEIT